MSNVFEVPKNEMDEKNKGRKIPKFFLVIAKTRVSISIKTMTKLNFFGT